MSKFNNKDFKVGDFVEVIPHFIMDGLELNTLYYVTEIYQNETGYDLFHLNNDNTLGYFSYRFRLVELVYE